MTTASTNGATRATRRVMEGQDMLTTTASEFRWLNDNRYRVAMPENETRWLRQNARHGATIVTDANGIRTAYVGLPTKWSDRDGHYEQANGIQPRARRGKNGAHGIDILGRRVPTRKRAID
jgi:hypothetical protein